MRKRVTLLSTVSLLLLLPLPVLAANHEAKADPQAVEVLEKDIKAIGGPELLGAVQTMVKVGKISGDLNLRVSGWVTDQNNTQRAGSLSRPMPRARRTGELQVFEKVPRMYAELVQVDGKLWYEFGVYSKGKDDFYFLNIPEVWSHTTKMDKDNYHAQSLYDQLLRWKEYYKAIQYEGEKTFEGHPAIALKFYPDDGSMAYSRYYDPQTWLELGEGNTRFKVVFTDYREVSGVKVAFAVHSEYGGDAYEIKLDRVTFNEKFDDSFFDPNPKEK